MEQILIHQRERGIRFGRPPWRCSSPPTTSVVGPLAAVSLPLVPGQRPENPELVVAANPFSDEAEAFRELRSQLMMGVMGGEEPRRALAVLSPNIGDGKTYLAANLAVAFSQLGGRALLVDATCARRASKMFGLGKTIAGLSGIL